MLFHFAYMRVGRRADAEDIVQDVFLKLFRSSESLNKKYLTSDTPLSCALNDFICNIGTKQA